MTLETARQTVAGYGNIDPTDAIVNGVDLLTQSLDNARLFAERQYDFFGMQDQLLATAFTNQTFSIPPNIKKIQSCFLEAQTQYGGPVRVISLKDVNRRSRYFSTLPQQTLQTPNYSKSRELALVMVNPTKGYLFPQDTSGSEPVQLRYDAIMWAASYQGLPGVYEDFFLRNGYDWLTYRALWELRMRVSKGTGEEQINITNAAKMAAEGLQNFIAYDLSLSEGVYDQSLS